MTKGKKTFLVKPSLYAACVELAKGNPAAGGLLCQLALMTEKGSLKDEKGVVGWVAASSQQLRTLTAFTRHQHDGALKTLKGLELVDCRRRKLSYKHKTPLIWLRLSDKTKSAIEEIMRRDPIPAFAEKGSGDISDSADAADAPVSAGTEILDKNVITKNEDKSENVIGKETKTENESKKYQDKKQEEKSVSKRARYNQMMGQIYQECPHLPYEPYSEFSAKVLEDAKKYIEDNPGGFLDDCPAEKSTYAHVLGRIFYDWDDFSSFIVYLYNGYNMPPVPQMWCLRHHLEAIPDYTNYANMRRKFEEALKEQGIPATDEYTLWCKELLEFVTYRKLAHERRNNFIQNKVKQAEQKWEAEKEKEEKWNAMVNKKKEQQV